MRSFILADLVELGELPGRVDSATRQQVRDEILDALALSNLTGDISVTRRFSVANGQVILVDRRGSAYNQCHTVFTVTLH